MSNISAHIYNLVVFRRYTDNLYKLVTFKVPVLRSGLYEREYLRGVNLTKLDNNLSRAKNKVFELAVCNDFDYFVTLTIDKNKYNRYDLKSYYKDLTQFIRNFGRKYSISIKYIFIPEMHRDGAWHIHGLIKGIPNECLEINSNGYLDFPAYRDRFGYISLSRIRSPVAVSRYITKYITKSMAALSSSLNAHLYYASKGLNTSQEVIRGSLLADSETSALSYDYENDFVRVKWFSDCSILSHIIT